MASTAAPAGRRASRTRTCDPARPRGRPAARSNADERLCAALGPEIVEAFTILKRGEWERYRVAAEDPPRPNVTDWELRYYLPFH